MTDCTERDLEVARACYMGEISMVDHWFGYLMERVRVLNLLDDTAIIFVSDHGFYFGEHGLFGKRRFRWPDGSGFDEGFAKGLTVHQRQVYRSPLHNEVIQVPLLVYLPGVENRRVSGLAFAARPDADSIGVAGDSVARTNASEVRAAPDRRRKHPRSDRDQRAL